MVSENAKFHVVPQMLLGIEQWLVTIQKLLLGRRKMLLCRQLA
jgi:hypothetical protein